MPTTALTATVLTLGDWAKRLDPDGKVPVVVELLSQTNEVLTDMLWKEGNLPTGHRTTVRTGLPSVAWRLLNAGTTPSKSTTAQIDEQAAMLEAWSEVDVDLANLNGNVNSFRLSEAMAFLEAMNQEWPRRCSTATAGSRPRSSPDSDALLVSVVHERLERHHGRGQRRRQLLDLAHWLGRQFDLRYFPEGLEGRPHSRGLWHSDRDGSGPASAGRRCAPIRSAGNGRPASR